MSTRSEKLGQQIAGNMAGILGSQRPKIHTPEAMDANTDDVSTGRRQNYEQGTIEIARVVPDPAQPRKEFSEESIRELADSIRAKGQLQNIGVRWNESLKKWLIIYGERRYRAITMLGLETINATFWETPPSEAEILEMQIVENDQRSNLRPVELARAYAALKEKKGCTIDELASHLKKAKSTVSKAMALLKLPDDLQVVVDAEDSRVGAITAYEIVSSTDDPDKQRELFKVAIERHLTREQVINLIQESMGGKQGRTKKEPAAAASGKGIRIGFRLQGGGSVTLAGVAEEPSYDEVLGLLDALTKRVKSAKQKGLPVTELQEFLKDPPDKKPAKKPAKAAK